MSILDDIDEGTLSVHPPGHYAVLLGYQAEQALRMAIREAASSLSFFERLAWQDRCVNGVPLFVSAHVAQWKIVCTEGRAERLADYLAPLDIEAYALWLLARGVLPVTQP
jgi:hypothetical protein